MSCQLDEVVRVSIQERPPLTVGPNQSLADVVYREMRTLILDGKWSPRSRLPSETELAQHFGMSRPVIRQALARLRTDGLIISRQGSGSYVKGTVTPDRSELKVQFPIISSVADLESFLNFREGVEGEAAATAAKHCTEEQLNAIMVAHSHFSTEGLRDQSPQQDFAFHLAVAQASGNPFYANTLEALKEHILFGLNMAWTFAGRQPDFSQTILSQHEAIISAIRSHDPEAARTAMRGHLGWSRSKLLTGHPIVDVT